jgi:hypothetical protein
MSTGDFFVDVVCEKLQAEFFAGNHKVPRGPATPFGNPTPSKKATFPIFRIDLIPFGRFMRMAAPVAIRALWIVVRLLGV